MNNLAEALDSKYDRFYKNQPKVSFSACKIGYLIDSEGPQKFDVYGGDEKKRRKGWWLDHLFGWIEGKS